MDANAATINIYKVKSFKAYLRSSQIDLSLLSAFLLDPKALILSSHVEELIPFLLSTFKDFII